MCVCVCWHEGCSENRRQTAKRDRKRQTPKGGRRLAPHSPLLKNRVRTGREGKEKKENRQPKGGMGGRYTATTQGF